jgi:UDP-N-acetylmuramoyl-L-alanyl-D-glutamate--2,6-diaminopimelate ligase
LNLDDPFGRRLHESLNTKTVTFGFNPKADVHVESWQGDISGTQVQLRIGSDILRFRSKLIGAFNVANLTAAAATGVALQLEFKVIAAGLEQVSFVPGRLQTYLLKNDVTAVIDYAHTPDALEKALQALRPLTKGRLIVLFGAGGDRDTGKRPLMGKIAEAQADLAIITTDNPRTEQPEAIIRDILSGMNRPDKYMVITDRREAIAEAVALAQPGDVLLIAGKGHETYQEINGVKHDFNEADILRKADAHV